VGITTEPCVILQMASKMWRYRCALVARMKELEERCKSFKKMYVEEP